MYRKTSPPQFTVEIDDGFAFGDETFSFGGSLELCNIRIWELLGDGDMLTFLLQCWMFFALATSWCFPTAHRYFKLFDVTQDSIRWLKGGGEGGVARDLLPFYLAGRCASCLLSIRDCPNLRILYLSGKSSSCLGVGSHFCPNGEPWLSTSPGIVQAACIG
jgi:hypothetical protein